jgi:XTP/dITP diphosphohydrolase
MKLIFATSNKGKIREFKRLVNQEVISYVDILGDFDIVEDGHSFEENALIKARTIYNMLGDEYVVISDDSGLSVPILGGIPNIYSARFAGENATDEENNAKLLAMLNEKNITSTPAFYTSAIAIVSKYGEEVVHGYMHGEVINEIRGDLGFGYDPIFVPTEYTQTCGEISYEEKDKLSHRAKAIRLAKIKLDKLM